MTWLRRILTVVCCPVLVVGVLSLAAIVAFVAMVAWRCL